MLLSGDKPNGMFKCAHREALDVLQKLDRRGSARVGCAAGLAGGAARRGVVQYARHVPRPGRPARGAAR